jgi:hydroxyethylthiazole kinase
VPHAAATWASLQAIRQGAPLVHNITNFVAMEVVANCLLGLGASPAMVQAEEEVEDFLDLAHALVVNIGTLSSGQLAAMRRAALRASALGRPWVVDPVGAGATPWRTGAAAGLVELRPTVIRGNASEVLALAGAGAGPTRGVDSSHGSDEAVDAAQQLAKSSGAVVAVTGEIDRITDGERWRKVSNGDVRMTRVTALGCAASAVIGAFLTVQPDPLEAATQGLAIFGLAGERAAARAAGPGSLRWHIVDELALLDETTVRGGVKIA